jgi:hypothetical protein
VDEKKIVESDLAKPETAARGTETDLLVEDEAAVRRNFSGCRAIQCRGEESWS